MQDKGKDRMGARLGRGDHGKGSLGQKVEMDGEEVAKSNNNVVVKDIAVKAARMKGFHTTPKSFFQHR